jgi:hypothetical protein
MDETVINGANLFYAPQFGIDPNEGNKSQNQWLLGLVNSAPYVCAALSSSILFTAHFSSSYVAPSSVVGSPNLSTVGSAVVAPSSSALYFPSSLAFGKVSPTHGSISSSLVFSSE